MYSCFRTRKKYQAYHFLSGGQNGSTKQKKWSRSIIIACRYNWAPFLGTKVSWHEMVSLCLKALHSLQFVHSPSSRPFIVPRPLHPRLFGQTSDGRRSERDCYKRKQSSTRDYYSSQSLQESFPFFLGTYTIILVSFASKPARNLTLQEGQGRTFSWVYTWTSQT